MFSDDYRIPKESYQHFHTLLHYLVEYILQQKRVIVRPNSYWVRRHFFSPTYVKQSYLPTSFLFIQGFLMRATSDPSLRRQRGCGSSTRKIILTTNTSHDAARVESLVLGQEVRPMAIQRVRSATANPTTRASNWMWPSVGEPGPLWQMGTTHMLQVGCRLPATTDTVPVTLLDSMNTTGQCGTLIIVWVHQELL